MTSTAAVPAGAAGVPAGAAAERRSDPRGDRRVRLRSPVEILASTRSGPVLLPGLLVDLSAGGCAAGVGLPLDPGTRVRLVLGLAHDHLAVLGQVVWAKPRHRVWVVGIRFEALPPPKREAIERFIFSARRHRPGPAPALPAGPPPPAFGNVRRREPDTHVSSR